MNLITGHGTGQMGAIECPKLFLSESGENQRIVRLKG